MCPLPSVPLKESLFSADSGGVCVGIDCVETTSSVGISLESSLIGWTFMEGDDRFVKALLGEVANVGALVMFESTILGTGKK